MTHLLKTKFALAVIVFSLLSVLVGASKAFQFEPGRFPFLSWTGWTIKSFLESTERSNVLFLGSSLVLVPLDGVDADFLGRKIDGSQHHNSCYFESKFKEATGLDVKSFTFALPGEMPSDAYLVVNNLLTQNKKPDVIVYGVGPRDFLDNLLPSPSATDPYRFLSRFGNLDPVASRMMPDWLERFNYELGKLFYVYGQRIDLADWATNKCVGLVNSILPLPKDKQAMSFDDRRLLAPEYRPCEVLAGQALFRPSTPKEWANFSDNLAEYKKRYGKLKWDTYLTQLSFFAETLEAARRKNIRVVVVMMPITDINRSLLSDFNWNLYCKSVSTMANRKGASVIDLSETDYFQRSDFMDTVHLHSLGGRKWLDVVVASMSGNDKVLSALKYSTAKSGAARIAKEGGETQL